MGNIIKDKDDLILLKDIINYTQKHELSVRYLEEILEYLLPKDNDKLLTGFYVRNSGSSAAFFAPTSNKIILSINRINEWLDRQLRDFDDTIDTEDKEKFRSYFLLFMITHEIEHAYQYLIANGIVGSSNDVLKNAYNGLYQLMIRKQYIIPRPITVVRRIVSRALYQSKQNFYLLERNANILSLELINDCAIYCGDDEVQKFFDELMRLNILSGYTDSTIGSIEETYRRILMYDKYKKFYHDMSIDTKEKVRYGFKIDEDTREKVLKLKMDI